MMNKSKLLDMHPPLTIELSENLDSKRIDHDISDIDLSEAQKKLFTDDLGAVQYFTGAFISTQSDDDEKLEILYGDEIEIDFTDDSEWRPEEMEEELKNSLFLLFDLKIIIENERKKYRYVSYEYVKLDIRKEMRKRMIEQEIKWGKEKERETTLEGISSNFSTTTMYKLQ